MTRYRRPCSGSSSTFPLEGVYGPLWPRVHSRKRSAVDESTGSQSFGGRDSALEPARYARAQSLLLHTGCGAARCGHCETESASSKRPSPCTAAWRWMQRQT